MPDILVAVDFAIAQSGKPYRAYGARFGPDYYDCSGLWVTAHKQAGINVPGNVGNTVGIYNWAVSIGGIVSVERALQIKGATLLRGRGYGYGALGHVEIALADGREVGAHSRRSGIGIRTCDPSRYQDGFLIPGVDYHLAPPVDPAVIEALKKLDAWRDRVTATPLRFGDQNGDVAILVDLLRAKHFLRKGVTGNKYGTTLRTGVVKFKNVVPELADQPAPDKGENFGGDAADALLALP